MNNLGAQLALTIIGIIGVLIASCILNKILLLLNIDISIGNIAIILLLIDISVMVSMWIREDSNGR